MRTVFILTGLVAVLATPAAAQSRQTEASVTIERSVGVSVLARMTFKASAADPAPMSTPASAVMPPPEETALSSNRGLPADTPAVIQVSGDPGRAYRINLPRTISEPSSNATIAGFTVWSRNSGDITTTLSAHMDETGRDTLRVTGFLSAAAFTDVSAAVPITVNYE